MQPLEMQPASHPDDPLNWPVSRKWVVTAALSASGFNRIAVSTMMAPALPIITSELNLSGTEGIAALGAFVLATAFSPLVAGPMSEVYGRAPIFHFTNVWFLAFNIACGFAKSGPALIACRFLAGFGAGAIFPLAAGVMGDLWPPERRGVSLSVYLLIPLLGAGIGPIVGGFVEQYTTWRWIFWSTSILQLITIGICWVWFRETHLSTIVAAEPNRFPLRLIWTAIVLPPKQLATHRSVQLQAALSGFGYGILYLVLSTFSSLFTDQYDQSISISGLHYISLCLGEIVGSQIGGQSMDYLARRAKALTKSDGFKPEFHLPIVAPGCLIAALGFLLFGWAANYRLPWIVVDVGGFILSLGLQMTGQGLQAYNMDSFPNSRASTSAAVQLFRSLAAFGLPLAGPAMYSKLGYGWANTLLGCLYVGGNIGAAGYLWKQA